MANWVFEEQRGAAVRRSPQETELFKSDQAAEGEYAGNDALVREIIQNAIDAHNGNADEQLCVRLAVHESDTAPSSGRLAEYFERLREPLLLRGVEVAANGSPSIPCRYLVCEDFGTRGLEGDISLCTDPAIGAKSRQDFYWFWRNIGRSGKTGEDLGRWGLGKTVYRAASNVGCMFGLSVRRSDRRAHLMGQAVLQIHTRDGREYMPEGYWCSHQDDTDLPIPIESDDEIRRFANEWHLTRSTEPGLSVVAPYIHENIRAERLLEAVTVNFFLRIVRGELVVEISGSEIGDVRLDSDSIANICESIIWNGPKRMKRHLAPPISFARECLQTKELVSTTVLGTEKLPEMNELTFDDRTLHELRRNYSAGVLVAVRVRMMLVRLQRDDVEGVADVYLRRLHDGSRCESYYVREGMTITKITSKAASRGVQSLVLVEPGPLAELLGDTEGPAHEDWHTASDRPDKQWKMWKGRVKFARRLVDNLSELLTPPITEPDFDLLSDFFSIERTISPQRQRVFGDELDTKPRMKDVVANPKWFYVSSRSGGFTVGRNREVDLPVDARLRIQVAYDIPSGNPLRKWSPYDFKFSTKKESGLIPQGDGVKPEHLGGNSMTLAVTDDEFKVIVKGFDKHRDLFVRVDEVSHEDMDLNA